MRLFYTFLILLTVSPSFAQDSLPHLKETQLIPINKLDSQIQKNTLDSGHSINGLVERKSDKIDLLIEEYLENKKYNGYRIQIFSSSNNKWEAVKAKSEFIRLFPQIKSYLVYQAPNFKVRVGDFLDRLEANEMLKLIQVSFPSAFIVKGEVEPKVN